MSNTLLLLPLFHCCVISGPSNATMVAVFHQGRYDRFIKEHPDILKNTNASTLQSTFTTTLAQLFGRTVVLQGKGKCSAAAAAARRSKGKQSGEGHGGRDKGHPVAQPGVDAAAAGRPKGQNDTAAAAAVGTGTDKEQSSAIVAAGNTSAASTNGTVPSQNGASLANSTGAAGNNTSTVGASKSSSASSNTSTSRPTAGSVSTTNSTGHRRLLLQLLHQKRQPRAARRQKADTAPYTDVAGVKVAAAMPDSSTAKLERGSYSSPRSTAAVATTTAAAVAAAAGGCTDEQEDQEAEEEFKSADANSSNSVGNLEGSILYLQDSNDVVLQPNDQCKFQYLVTRNPGLLGGGGGGGTSAGPAATATHGTVGSRRGAGAAAPAATSRSSVAEEVNSGAGGSGSGGVSWVVFSSVSVVLGMLVIFMGVKLVARRSELKVGCVTHRGCCCWQTGHVGHVAVAALAEHGCRDPAPSSVRGTHGSTISSCTPAAPP